VQKNLGMEVEVGEKLAVDNDIPEGLRASIDIGRNEVSHAILTDC